MKKPRSSSLKSHIYFKALFNITATSSGANELTHPGWVTHICINNLIGSGPNFSEILIEIETYSFKKILCVWKCCPQNGGYFVRASMCCCLTSPLFSILGLLPTLWCPISHSNNLWTLLCSHRVNWPTACQHPWGALSHHLQTRALLPAAGSPPPRPHRHSLLWQARRSMAIPGPAPWRKPWTEQVIPTVNLMPTPLWQLLHSQSVVEIVNQMPTLLQHLLNTPRNQSQPSSHRVKWTIIL